MDDKTLDVLVADDDPLGRLVLETGIDMAGARSTLTQSCAEGISEFSKDPQKYGLIFTDLDQTPSGLDLIREVRKSNSEAPIYIVTGNPESPLVIEAKKLPGKNYLMAKPFGIKEILPVIEQVIVRDQTLSETAMMIHHEIRNPLCAIKNGAQILRDYCIANIPSEKKTDYEIMENFSLYKKTIESLNQIIAYSNMIKDSCQVLETKEINKYKSQYLEYTKERLQKVHPNVLKEREKSFEQIRTLFLENMALPIIGLVHEIENLNKTIHQFYTTYTCQSSQATSKTLFGIVNCSGDELLQTLQKINKVKLPVSVCYSHEPTDLMVGLDASL